MIRQIHYTSCRHGRDGIQGFQVAAATPGIPRHHEDLVLPLGAYRPPPSASPVPDPAESAALPVAFGYRDFGDVAVLFRSHYLGEDYTGRQGNYFAHLLLADDGRDLREILPAAVWDGADWFRGPFDDTGAASTLLPTLDTLAEGPFADGNAVRAWLDRAPTGLPRLLHAVLDALDGRTEKVIVVGGGAQPDVEVATAVLAVTAALPDVLARRVSFTTFTTTPSDVDLLVVGTTPDTPLGSDRNRVVVTLDEAGESGRWSPFTVLAADRLRAGPTALAALRELAARVVPPLAVADLDSFAAAARLLEREQETDVLTGLEFIADRFPGGVGPELWPTVEAAQEAGTVRPADDVARWSALLQRTTGQRPLLEQSYVNAVLTSVASGVDGQDLWLPAVRPDQVDGGVWIGVAVENTPRPEVLATMLTTLGRLGVETADEELGEVVEHVLLPLVLDPHGDIEVVRRLPVAGRLAGAVVERLEGRLADDLIETAADTMSVAAARWLATAVTPGTHCALVTQVKLARVGERDPVAVLATATDGPALDRLAGLMWSAPPTLPTAKRLGAELDPAVLRQSAVPASLAERLVLDAREKRVGPEHVELARSLDALGEGLDEYARGQVDAVLLTERFRDRPPSGPDTRKQAVAAVTCHADPALAEPLFRLLVHWVFVRGEALTHADMLEAAFTPGSPAFLAEYEKQLARTLSAADTDGILAVLPAVVHLSATQQAAADLLDGLCAEALAQRKRKALDDVEQRLSEVGSVSPDLRPARATNWTAWWKSYRANHLAVTGFRDRILRFGRDG